MTDEAKRLVEHLRKGEISQAMAFDASCLIVYLDAALEHTKRERDAAIADMRMAAITLCNVCKHYHTDFPCGGGIDCDDVHVTIACSMFEWRGLQEK